jgi:hypothetical protein
MTDSFPLQNTARSHLRQPASSDAVARIAAQPDIDWMSWLRWYGVDPVVGLPEAACLAELFTKRSSA